MSQEESTRLNRAIAARGFCSRRKADELIFAGNVQVNGKIEKNPGVRVTQEDRIFINGKELTHQPVKLYYMLNKPVQCICSLHDPQGRHTIVDFFPEKMRGFRIYPIGRLDYFSEGLLLLTNDGDMAQFLAHPRHHKKKIYEVLIRGQVNEECLANMRAGMQLSEGIKLQPVGIKAQRLKDGNTLLKMELRQGINRQIRKMCDQCGLTILRLKRVEFGGLSLGNLAPGCTRPLTEKEIESMGKIPRNRPAPPD